MKALRNDLHKTAAAIYKAYLKKISDDTSKSSAALFDNDEIYPLLEHENKIDVGDFIRQIIANFSMKSYIDGTFLLNDNFLTYCEMNFNEPTYIDEILEQ